METHLVHRDSTGHVVVVGLLVEAGQSNMALEAIWSKLPRKAGETGSEHSVSLNALLPASTHHYSYHGSLTTPPCTEGVQWIVLREPIAMSAEQIERFVEVIGHNARPIQPLHDRKVFQE